MPITMAVGVVSRLIIIMALVSRHSNYMAIYMYNNFTGWSPIMSFLQRLHYHSTFLLLTS